MEILESKCGTTTLEPGCIYRIHHRRKGVFVATLIAVEQTKPGDPQDSVFYRVQINTGEGSPYAWMSNVKVVIGGRKTTPLVTEKLIRPSLVELIERMN